MPWRDQLRLGWKIIRCLYWTEVLPVWAVIAGWIISAAAIVAGLTGNLWGFAACVAATCVVGWVAGGRKS